MNKKFTLLIIPDDDSGTKSYNISKNLLKYFIVSISVILIVFIIISIKLIPGISKYDDLKKKYNILAQERLKVIELSENLKRIKQMNQFVRNSLGV